MRHPITLLLPLSLALAACSDDEPATDPNAACEITEHTRIAAPPDGWSLQEDANYNLHVLGDLILYTFDDQKDPEREYWRLDRCTGEAAPFPSLAPGLHSPYIVDTPAGRVLYAYKDSAYYVVDRLDVPGDDTPKKIAGLPSPDWIDLNLCNDAAALPYACFWREGSIYTHTGDPEAPALPVTRDTTTWIPYPDAILHIDQSGDLRQNDPFTGTSELLITGTQYPEIVDVGPVLGPDLVLGPGASAADARVIWQPSGEPTLYLRRIGDGVDIPLAVDPALTASPALVWPPNGNTVIFLDRESHTILAAVRADNGAALTVPEHIGYSLSLGNAINLTLAAPNAVVQAIWKPETSSLHPWYRGPDPAPSPDAYDGESVDYHQPDAQDPSVGSLWRVDLASGEKRQLAARVSQSRRRISERLSVMSFRVPASDPLAPQTSLDDLEYLDLETGRATPIALSASAVEPIPDQGVIYLDAHGEAPGLWVAPLP